MKKLVLIVLTILTTGCSSQNSSNEGYCGYPSNFIVNKLEQLEQFNHKH